MRFGSLLAAALFALLLSGCEDPPLNLTRAAATQEISGTCAERVRAGTARFPTIAAGAACTCVVDRMLGSQGDVQVQRLSRTAFDVLAESAYPDCFPEAFPPAVPGDAAAQAARIEQAAVWRYRASGIETCVGDILPSAGIADPRGFCACTLDAYVAGKRSTELRPLSGQDLTAILGPQADQCRGTTIPAMPVSSEAPPPDATQFNPDQITAEADRALEEARRAADNALAEIPVDKPQY